MCLFGKRYYSFQLTAVTNYHKFNTKTTVAKTNTNLYSFGGHIFICVWRTEVLNDSHLAQVEESVGLCSSVETLGETPFPVLGVTVLLSLWPRSVLKASNGQLDLSLSSHHSDAALVFTSHSSLNPLPPFFIYEDLVVTLRLLDNPE